MDPYETMEEWGEFFYSQTEGNCCISQVFTCIFPKLLAKKHRDAFYTDNSVIIITLIMPFTLLILFCFSDCPLSKTFIELSTDAQIRFPECFISNVRTKQRVGVAQISLPVTTMAPIYLVSLGPFEFPSRHMRAWLTKTVTFLNFAALLGMPLFQWTSINQGCKYHPNNNLLPYPKLAIYFLFSLSHSVSHLWKNIRKQLNCPKNLLWNVLS